MGQKGGGGGARKYFELDGEKYMTYEHFGGAAPAVSRGKFVDLSAYIKKRKKG